MKDVSIICAKAREIRKSRNELSSFEAVLRKLPKRITLDQMSVLYAVSYNPESSQVLLCSDTGIDRSTMADVIRRLVSKGLLTVQRSAHDRRTNSVRLTREGKNVLNACLKAEKKFKL